ncbi:EAL domain-containing protein [Enterobacteriaceae bacterium 8376wB9]|nr:EAL domain-containing protein [Enterobacteriaceae bacterium 8376wB9]
MNDDSEISSRQSYLSGTHARLRGCILSPCHFAAAGLSALLSGVGYPDFGIAVPGEPSFTDMQSRIRTWTPAGCIVAYFPDEPLYALTMLKALSSLMLETRQAMTVLLLARARHAWLYRSLQRLVPGRSRLSNVRVLPVTGMQSSQFWQDTTGFPLLSACALLEERHSGVHAAGLTLRELDVMLDMFNGESIREQIKSGRCNVAAKTIYNQRMTGLKKLSTQFSGLAALLPGRQRPEAPGAPRARRGGFDTGEQYFADAIYQGMLYPVFQPVFSPDKRMVGAEVLSRWYRGGQVMSPGEFLPDVHSQQAWLLLTSLVLKSAVEKINQFEGRLWFSVNIPACLAGSSALLRLVDAARLLLKTPDWFGCLVLEFSEDTDLSKGARAVDILRELNERECRVFLDDCFSDNSVLFPVRQVKFSGYKLDMSVVSSFLHDDNDRSLIGGLVQYCQLTGKTCVAEGVDTAEKFATLKKMGVALFQGFYLSRPILNEELEATVRRLS